MNYCYRCGLLATYYIESKNKWACDKSAQKCPSVKSKIGKSNSVALAGKKLTDEHKAKIAKGITGRVLSPESKEKIKQSNLEHWSENTRIPWNKDKKGYRQRGIKVLGNQNQQRYYLEMIQCIQILKNIEIE